MALTDGIVGCWSPSLGVTGNRLLDYSNRRNHGVLTNMDAATDWVCTPVGLALDYDGVDDLTIAPKMPTFTGDFTASAWGFFYNGDPGYDCVLLRTTDVFGGASRSGISLVMRDAFTVISDRVGAEITDGTTRYHIESDTGVAQGAWVFLLCRRQSGTFALWVDGVQQAATQTFSGTITNNTSTYLGAVVDYQGAGGTKRRRVGEVAVWQRSLTTPEIRDLYRRGNGAIGRELTSYQRRKYFPVYPAKPSKASIVNKLTTLTPSYEDDIIGCWSPSLGVTGNTLRDVSGRNNHGTLTNMDPATDWVGTPAGLSLDYDGTDDYVALTRNLFSGLSVVSVAFWGQPRTTTERIDITQGTDNANRCGCGLAEDGNAYGFSQFSGTITGYGYAPWSQLGVSQPIHAVLIYNSKGADNAARSKVYLNAVQQTMTFIGSVSSLPLSQGGTPFFGARPGPSSYSNGRMGEIVVYNRELTPAEIRDLYRRGNGAIGKSLSEKRRKCAVTSSISRSIPKSKASIVVRPPKLSSNNLLKGIVGCWSPPLGVTGNTLRDVSGRNNHGTLTNMDPATDWVGTSRGLALDYDGSNDYISVSTNTWSGVNLPEVSMVAWVRLTKAGYGVLMSDASATGIIWAVGNSTVSGQWLYAGTKNYNEALRISGAITQNVWTMVGWSYRNRSVRFWRDASLHGTGTFGASVPLPNVSSGMVFSSSSINTATEVWQGQISEIAIYQRALNDAEFLELYRLGNGAIGRELKYGTLRSSFSSKTFPSTWLKVNNEWTEAQPKIATGSNPVIWQPAQPRLYTGEWQ